MAMSEMTAKDFGDCMFRIGLGVVIFASGLLILAIAAMTWKDVFQ